MYLNWKFIGIKAIFHCKITFADIFIPSPDNLVVNLHESKDLVCDLLAQLPQMFEKNMDTGSALGAAIQAAYKMVVSVW